MELRNSPPSERDMVAHELSQGLHLIYETTQDSLVKKQIGHLVPLSDYLCDTSEDDED